MHFSSLQWKEGGIDGRVSSRTGTSDRIVLTHCTGYASRLRLVGVRHGRARVITRGIEMCVLEGANTWSIAGSPSESIVIPKQALVYHIGIEKHSITHRPKVWTSSRLLTKC